MTGEDAHWPWPRTPAPPSDSDQLARQTARLFASPDGEAVLSHLRAMTLRRCLGPDAPDAALRHLEGQRHLVLHLHGLIARGQAMG